MRPTEILSAEHRVIERVLVCLERLAGEAAAGRLDGDAGAQLLDFVVTFADRCHHGKEEARLFPALGRKGFPTEEGPVAVMLDEHEQGRALVRRMRAALEAQDAAAFRGPALSFVQLLRDHIAKEDGILFPMADSVLGPEDQAALLSEFETVERDDLGAGTHERYLALARALCVRFEVDWDAVPTAAAMGHGCGGHH